MGGVATDELARRYGRPQSPGRRRVIIAVLAAVMVAAVSYAGGVALTTGNPSVTWEDVGYRNTSAGVEATFEVTFTAKAAPADAAVCTVQALNQVRTVIGSRDVRVGPAGPSVPRTIRVTAAVRTSEPANTALVSDCVIG